MRAGLVDVDFRKWGDRPHYRFGADLLGEDADGTWLAARAGTSYTGPVCGTYANDFLILVPRKEWWIAEWALSDRIELYVDITTPPVWPTANRVTAVDLDLDVIRFIDGSVVLDDEDEFDAHRALYGYPDDVVEHARVVAREVADAAAAARPPFGPARARWLDLLG